MNHRVITLLCGLLLMLGACSKEQDAKPSPAPKANNNPLHGQTEALHKVRQVEVQLQDAANQQRQRIEEQEH